VGFIFTVVPWDHFLIDLIPDGVRGIRVVLRNSCEQAVTYDLDDDYPVYIGLGSLQDPNFDDQKRVVDLNENYFDPDLTGSINGHCVFFLDVYSSRVFEERYHSNLPIVFTVIIATLFAFMAAIFIIYDMSVQKRNNKVVGAAARSNAIVSSLFPSNVRDRLLADREAESNQKGHGKGTLRGYLSGDKQNEGSQDDIYKTKPIADLFPETTLLFGDIVGFTAWSSVREPSQVFTLLETVYHAFDEIAKKRRVFKVETVGDCYVAVVGLPEPRKDHAVVMARFARDCMLRMWSLTKKLETTLGPDTGDLTMRMGLHSGPVTAGVLRGERSRFQLFGDTMNTCARMESTGLKSKIHISEETANLLI
jgi:class 3 adenylate cyclase